MTEPAQNPESVSATDGLLRWMLEYLRPYRKRVALLSVLLVSEIVLGALQPWPLAIVIDYVLTPASAEASRSPPAFSRGLPRSPAATSSSLLIGVVVLGVVLQVVNQFVSAYGTQVQVDTGQRMVYDLRGKLFSHLTALGLNHHITTSTADAVYRVDVDAYAIENLVMSGLFPLATSTIALAVMFGWLFYMNVTIALLSLTVVPFLYLCLRFYTRTLVNREERVKELEAKLLGRLYETFGAMKLVKSFAREPLRAAALQDQRRHDHGRAHRDHVAAVAVLGGGEHHHHSRHRAGRDRRRRLCDDRPADHRTADRRHQLSRGRLRTALGDRSHDGPAPGRARRHQARARDVRADSGNRGGARRDRRGRHQGRRLASKTSASPIPNGSRVLHDISFAAKPGEVIALVGLTGAGKTTLVSLIPRFYDPTVGRVTIDGVDVRQYRVRSLREKIAIVLQDPVLFAGTIADNLRYGRLDATDEEVEQAARAAHAHEFIARLPNGYQTEIAQAGGSLSGGERQRLSVARAILKNAPILILDEPTSSLDSISEEIVFAALRRLRAGRTTIVIAHRLSTVRDADRILVLDGGEIAAQGRHEELLKSSQLYRRMCARLSVGKSLDDPESVDELIEAAKR